MATVTATWNTDAGDWFVAGNWQEPNPNPPPDTVSYVPDANNDVQIYGGSDAASDFTITYDGTDTVNTLANDGIVTLDITGGSLGVVAGGFFDSLTLATGATVDLGGNLNLNSGSFAGTVSGTGALRFVNGDFAIEPGFAPTVATWLLDYQTGSAFVSNTTLYTSLSYAGDFILESPYGDAPFLNLNGYTLTLSGISTLNGNIDGTGTLLNTGTSTIGGSQVGNDATNGYAAANAATIENAAAVEQDGGIALNGTIQNDAGATWTDTAAANITAEATGATFTNDGTFANDGSGIGYVSADFDNTGTLAIASGATFELQGTNVLDGAISGVGTLTLDGSTTLDPASFTVGTLDLQNGVFSLDENLTYAGTLDDQSGDYGGSYLNLGGDTLSLSGTSALTAGAIYGSGSVLNTGTATIGGNIALGYDPVSGYAAADTFTLENAGSVSQTGNIGLNATILNEAGATYTISAGNISAEASAATFINDGTFDDDGSAINYVGADFDTNGTLAIASGATLDFEGSASSLDGTVSGTGTLILNGSTALEPASLTVSTLDLQGGTFVLGESLAYAGAFDLQGGYFGGGYLGLGGDTLTLSGASVFSGGYVYGPGSVVNTGTATLDSLNLGNGPTDGDGTDDVATFENAATVVQDGNVELNGTIQNDLGATYTISAGNISAEASAATFTNDGTFDDDGSAINYVGADFDTNGTLAIASGATLDFEGSASSLDGTVSGTGTLILNGSTALEPASLTVSTLDLQGGYLRPRREPGLRGRIRSAGRLFRRRLSGPGR